MTSSSKFRKRRTLFVALNVITVLMGVGFYLKILISYVFVKSTKTNQQISEILFIWISCITLLFIGIFGIFGLLFSNFTMLLTYSIILFILNFNLILPFFYFLHSFETILDQKEYSQYYEYKFFIITTVFLYLYTLALLILSILNMNTIYRQNYCKYNTVNYLNFIQDNVELDLINED